MSQVMAPHCTHTAVHTAVKHSSLMLRVRRPSALNRGQTTLTWLWQSLTPHLYTSIIYTSIIDPHPHYVATLQTAGLPVAMVGAGHFWRPCGRERHWHLAPQIPPIGSIMIHHDPSHIPLVPLVLVVPPQGSHQLLHDQKKANSHIRLQRPRKSPWIPLRAFRAFRALDTWFCQNKTSLAFQHQVRHPNHPGSWRQPKQE